MACTRLRTLCNFAEVPLTGPPEFLSESEGCAGAGRPDMAACWVGCLPTSVALLGFCKGPSAPACLFPMACIVWFLARASCSAAAAAGTCTNGTCSCKCAAELAQKTCELRAKAPAKTKLVIRQGLETLLPGQGLQVCRGAGRQPWGHADQGGCTPGSLPNPVRLTGDRTS